LLPCSFSEYGTWRICKSEEVTGGRRKLHEEELHNLYSSPNIISMIKSRRMRWEDPMACMGDMRNVYKVLVTKPEGIRPLGRPRHKWVNNIKMILKK
jgi:hypothetical protein